MDWVQAKSSPPLDLQKKKISNNDFKNFLIWGLRSRLGYLLLGFMFLSISRGLSIGPAGLTSPLGYIFMGFSVVLSIFRGISGVSTGLACCLRVDMGFELHCSGLGSGRRNLRFLRYPLLLIHTR